MSDKDAKRLPPISFEAHSSYVIEAGRLEFFFLWNWLKKHSDDNFRDAIRDRVDLARKTDPNIDYLDKVPVNFDHPRWKQIENGLFELFCDLSGSGAASEFEKRAFELCRDDFIACAEYSYFKGDYWAAFSTYQCGSLKYDPPDNNYPKTVSFHIKNACAPKSIFDDPEYLPSCLMTLVAKAENEYGAERLQTETWLNSHPKWLELFPDEWKKSLSTENKEPGWGYGLWGQFISASGKFNSKRGDILRKTGEFPYYPRRASCSFKSLREHLEKRLNVK